MHWIIFCLAGAYIAWVFPFAFFRHDDWLIIGNAVTHLEKSWSFLFSPTLFSQRGEEVWFFRPGFKLCTNLFFHAFGYRYELWLTTLLGMFIGALYFGQSIVKKITGSRKLPLLFVLLVTASVHLHFGSLVWMGEGMMNCPQLLLLSMSSYFLVLALFDESKSRLFNLYSLLAYLFALSFKESSIFHLGFNFFLVMLEPGVERVSKEHRKSLLRPHFIVSLAYLVFRLGFIPLNPNYSKEFEIVFAQIGLLKFVAAFSLVSGSILFVLRMTDGEAFFDFIKGMRARKLAFVFLLGCLVPYLGHSFFSPGWLLVPGYYLALFCALSARKVYFIFPIKTFTLVASLIFGISSSVVLYQLIDVQWWKWEKGQKQMLELAMSAPPKSVEKVVVRNCPNYKRTKLSLMRVVGFKDSLHHLWTLEQKQPVQIFVRKCEDPFTEEDLKLTSSVLLDWKFPKFEVVRFLGKKLPVS